MNANMDKNGVHTPYFDGGLVKMNKAGKFPYMSTRNNNFSNRNMMGAMCVAEGVAGKCVAGESCQRSMEKELLANYKNENADGTPKSQLVEISETSDMKLARLKEQQRKIAEEIALLQKH
jgi:hypothetical protein